MTTACPRFEMVSSWISTKVLVFSSALWVARVDFLRPRKYSSSKAWRVSSCGMLSRSVAKRFSQSFQKTNKPCDGLHAINYARLALILRGHIIKRQAQSISSPLVKPVLAYFSGKRFRY